MKIASLVAEELGLPPGDLVASEGSVTGNGVTSFELASPSTGRVLQVFVCRETEDEALDELQHAAAMAGFYNAKFFHEMIQYDKVDVPVGRLSASFKIDDEGIGHAVFAVDSQPGRSLKTLTLEQCNTVAETLAKLHAHGVGDEAVRETIGENHKVVRENLRVEYGDNHPANLHAVQQHSSMFNKAGEVGAKLRHLQSFLAHSPHIPPKQTVICHGALTGEQLVWNGDELKEITDWDSVHYGDPAEDLTRLLVASCEEADRERGYMQVFRHYYYTLVDLKAPRFKLDDLRHSYDQLKPRIVVEGFERLCSLLASPCSATEKQTAARRWETALDEAILVADGEEKEHVEQALFA